MNKPPRNYIFVIHFFSVNDIAKLETPSLSGEFLIKTLMHCEVEKLHSSDAFVVEIFKMNWRKLDTAL